MLMAGEPWQQSTLSQIALGNYRKAHRVTGRISGTLPGSRILYISSNQFPIDLQLKATHLYEMPLNVVPISKANKSRRVSPAYFFRSGKDMVEVRVEKVDEEEA